jgi:hypothetical protein
VCTVAHDLTDDLLDHLLADAQSLRGALHELRDAAVDGVDPELLDLCRAQIALLIGLGPPPVEPLRRDRTQRERVCIDFTEQFVLDVAGITDAQVAALVSQFGSNGATEFVYSLLAVEQRLRMQALWTHLGLAVAS